MKRNYDELGHNECFYLIGKNTTYIIGKYTSGEFYVEAYVNCRYHCCKYEGFNTEEDAEMFAKAKEEAGGLTKDYDNYYMS